MKKTWLILSLLVLFTAAAVAQPSQNSTSTDPGLIPGDIFYPVEQFAESLEVTVAGLIGGPDFKAKAIANNAEESLAEASILAERNNSRKASEMAQNYYNQMNRSKNLVESSKNSNLSQELSNISRKNVERLEKVKEKVPHQARAGIENAIQNSRSLGQRNGNSAKDPKEIPANSKPKEAPENPQNTSSAEASMKNEDKPKRSEEAIGNISNGRKALNPGKESEETRNREEKSELLENPVTESENETQGSDKVLETSDNGSLDENPLSRNGKGLR